MYDLYVPMVDEFEMKVPFSKAKEIVKKGLAPLGKEYGKVLSDGMESGWLMYMRMREREVEPIPGELTDAIHLY